MNVHLSNAPILSNSLGSIVPRGFQNEMRRSFCSKVRMNDSRSRSDLSAISKDFLAVRNLRLGLPLRRKRDEPCNLAPSHVPARCGRPRTLLRVLTRVREDLGGCRDLFHSHRHGFGVRLPGDRDDSAGVVLATNPAPIEEDIKPCGFFPYH